MKTKGDCKSIAGSNTKNWCDKNLSNVIDRGVELALASKPEYKSRLRGQLRRAIDLLDDKLDFDHPGPATLGEIVEHMFESVLWFDREAYLPLAQDACVGVERLVDWDSMF